MIKKLGLLVILAIVVSALTITGHALYADSKQKPPSTGKLITINTTPKKPCSKMKAIKANYGVTVCKPLPQKKKTPITYPNNAQEPKPNLTPPKLKPTGSSFVDRLNEYRVAHGLPPVSYSQALSGDSWSYANVMSVKFPCDSATIQHSGYAGEVIACQCNGGFSDVLTEWLNSSGHRAILMANNYSTIGYGAVEKAKCTYYVARVG